MVVLIQQNVLQSERGLLKFGAVKDIITNTSQVNKIRKNNE